MREAVLGAPPVRAIEPRRLHRLPPRDIPGNVLDEALVHAAQTSGSLA